MCSARVCVCVCTVLLRFKFQWRPVSVLLLAFQPQRTKGVFNILPALCPIAVQDACISTCIIWSVETLRPLGSKYCDTGF